MKSKWNKVSASDVYEAVRIYDQSLDAHSPAQNTFLEINGKNYPAKHIRGLAYKVAYGATIPNSEFTGGAETVRFFENLGFTVIYEPKTHQPAKNPQAIINRKEKTDLAEASSQMADKKRDKSSKHFISVTHKSVIEQKNALQLVLNKRFDGDIVSEKTFDWLVTPYNDSEYNGLIDALHQYRGRTDFYKSKNKLRCDFVCESQKLIFEYDERQHFTMARKAALESYPTSITLYFDKQRWCAACEAIHAQDNYPPNRDEKRAYYDSIRDIKSAQNGYRLIRIMHGDYDWESNLAQQYINELLAYSAYVSEEVIAPQNSKNDKTETGDEDISVKIVTVTLQSMSTEKHGNETRLETLNKVVSEYIESDIILFPAGFFYYRSYNKHRIIESLEEVASILRAHSSNAVICLGVDCNNSRDQLAFAIAQSGVLACGRKFHPTEDENHVINIADSFNCKEMDLERIFTKSGKKFYLAVCYDVFGIRHQKTSNPDVDAILTLAHRFYPRGRGPSGDVDFARKGFAGASAQWNCPVFGTAVFFDRPIPDQWPTGVLWCEQNKSVKVFKYTDNQMHLVSKGMMRGCGENAKCIQYYL